MKKKTKTKLLWLFAIPVLGIGLAILCLYVKLHFDFPANTHGHDDFLTTTNINLINERVFVRYTGWEDTQTYFRFKASPDEIGRIVETKRLSSDSNFTQNSSFYWWNPKIEEGCQYFVNKERAEWTWLYYNPKSKDAYYFATTF